jgi:hypothetical protein
MSGDTESASQAQSNADSLAREAKHQAEIAKVMATRAADYAKELKAEERTKALAGEKNSVQKGTVDLFPELKLADADLIKRIRAGDVDGCLNELLELAMAHPRPNPAGGLRERATVMEALKTRGAREPVKT